MRAAAPGVLVLALVLAALAPPARAQPAADVERAKELYRAAEAAMREARYDDAVRDYGAAYELSKDPAFFYKLGSAHERAGKCDAALVYYRRYLREGQPTEAFAKLTAARIEACGGATAQPAPPAPGATAPPEASPEPGPAPEPKAEPSAEPEPKAEPGPTPGATGAAGAADPTAGGAPPPPPPPSRELGRHRGPWLLVGGSLALATVGAVFAYSANTAERDVEDLYVGLNGTPPPFNATTKRLYDDALAEGRRYETLSIVSFSLAGALAAGAAIWFALDRDEGVTVTPAVTSGGAGVSAALRF